MRCDERVSVHLGAVVSDEVKWRSSTCFARSVAVLFAGAMLALSLSVNDASALSVLNPFEEREFSTNDVSVVDGDTIKVGGLTYRLIGFDTPEVFSPSCPSELILGRRASTQLRRLLLAGNVATLLIDPGTDRYGRHLAKLSIDGHDVSRQMINGGFAKSYHGGQRESWCPY